MAAEFDQNVSVAPDAPEGGAQKTREQPITRFARFFKSYSLGLSLIVAAVPLGIARWSLIPMFESNKYALTILTSVASYLLVGYIFSQRQAIARLYFPGVRPGTKRGKPLIASPDQLKKSRFFGLLPSALALTSVALFVGYFWTVPAAINRAVYEYSTDPPQGTELAPLTRARLEPGLADKITTARLPFGQGKPVKIIREESKSKDKVVINEKVLFPDEESVHELLAGVPSTFIPLEGWMWLFFLGAFLCAASAFVLMGLKDYLQEVLGLSDERLITDPTVEATEILFQLEGAPGIFGKMAYSPQDPDYHPSFDGYYCADPSHTGLKLRPLTYDDKAPDVVVKWYHQFKTDKGVEFVGCGVSARINEIDLKNRLREGGWKEFQKEVASAGLSSRRLRLPFKKRTRKGRSDASAETPTREQTPPAAATPS